MMNQDKNFRNLGNLEFQKRSLIKAPSTLSLKSSSAHKRSVMKDRLGTPVKKGVLNHPDVDPTKLTKEQGQKIAEQI